MEVEREKLLEFPLLKLIKVNFPVDINESDREFVYRLTERELMDAIEHKNMLINFYYKNLKLL